MRQPIYNFMEFKDIKDMLQKTKTLYADRPAYIFKTDKEGVFNQITHKELRDEVD